MTSPTTPRTILGTDYVLDDLQVQAITQWGKRGLVEIVVLSGFYQMFAAINQGFGIRPAPATG